jgi:hypothetical protein
MEGTGVLIRQPQNKDPQAKTEFLIVYTKNYKPRN